MPMTGGPKERGVREWIDAKIQSRRTAIINELFTVGEQCLTQARSGHKYKSQTGNLCSSIGYMIIADGEPIHEGGWQAIAGKKGNGEEGKQTGHEYLHELAADAPSKGIYFIMCAGMPYARYVEDMSLDVLDTSEQMAQKKIRELLTRIFK